MKIANTYENCKGHSKVPHVCVIRDSKYVTKDVKCYNSGSLLVKKRFLVAAPHFFQINFSRLRLFVNVQVNNDSKIEKHNQDGGLSIIIWKPPTPHISSSIERSTRFAQEPSRRRSFDWSTNARRSSGAFFAFAFVVASSRSFHSDGILNGEAVLVDDGPSQISTRSKRQEKDWPFPMSRLCATYWKRRLGFAFCYLWISLAP